MYYLFLNLGFLGENRLDPGKMGLLLHSLFLFPYFLGVKRKRVKEITSCRKPSNPIDFHRFLIVYSLYIMTLSKH